MSAYRGGVASMIKRNLVRRAKPRKQKKESQASESMLTKPPHKSSQLQALIDLSHLPQEDMLLLLELNGTKHSRSVNFAARASAARRNANAGTAKASKGKARRPTQLAPLPARGYKLKFEFSEKKVYAVPDMPVVQTRQGQLPSLPAPKASSESPQSKKGQATTSRRTQLKSKRRKVNRTREPASSDPPSKRTQKEKALNRRRPKKRSGQQRRLVRSKCATTIQAFVRAYFGRQMAAAARSRIAYAKSLTSRAEDYEQRHGFEHWKFWMHEMTSSEDESDVGSDSCSDSDEGSELQEKRRLAKLQRRLEAAKQKWLDEQDGQVIHWRPWR